MADQIYQSPQAREYTPREINSAYFSAGSLFPSYEQMQSILRYARQPRNYSSNSGIASYRA